MKVIKDDLLEQIIRIIPEVKKPSELKPFPEVVSTLSSEELTDIHSHYMAWYSYIADKLKYEKALLTVAKLEMDTYYRKSFVAIPKKTTQKDKELLIKANDKYLEFEKNFEFKRTMVEILELELETLEKQIMTLRAELRRREVKP